jgi:RES domain-containing protein
MLVYRITQTKYAGSLFALGFAGRWNTEGESMIYTAGSASLACLRVLAHKSGAALNLGKFSMAVIEILGQASAEEINLKQLQDLHSEWVKVLQYAITQDLGNRLIYNMQSVVLKVPSAIVDREYNYLFNPLHEDFSKIKVLDITPFNFDTRLKLNIK